jgi:hypothetical protein
VLVGGIGVAGLDTDDQDEFAAVAAAQSAGFFVKLPLPDPGAVYIDGFKLPFASPTATRSAGAPGGVFQIAPRNGAPAAEGWLVGPLASATLTTEDVRGRPQTFCVRTTFRAVRIYGTDSTRPVPAESVKK